MPVLGLLAAALPALVSAGASLIGQRQQNKADRRAYKEMQKYNSPAEQMKRYGQAGLSPYLIYGQGNSGNVSSPAPSEYGTRQATSEFLSQGAGNMLANYFAYANMDVDLKNKWMQNSIMQKENTKRYYGAEVQELERDKKLLELYSDYPDYIGDLSQDVASTGYRRKLLELKREASKATVDRAVETVKNLKLKNVVDSVRAQYAKDYGMVGGDWTQGLGLLKSLPQLLRKGSSKAAAETLKKGVPPPWRSTIKTNPVRRVRRKPSAGVINP